VIDAVELTRALVRRPSVTPVEAGALDLLQGELERLGFSCARLPFGEVDNLWARIGSARPLFCFAGHVDVVPVGDPRGWTVDPFGATLAEWLSLGPRRGRHEGRHRLPSSAAAAGLLAAKRGRDFGGSISLLITGDEEGPAVNGTRQGAGLAGGSAARSPTPAWSASRPTRTRHRRDDQASAGAVQHHRPADA
jgi:succinyl-diaminopimelate desuccinylase